MIEASCHCGALTIRNRHRPRYGDGLRLLDLPPQGALWAYYSPKQVRLIPAEGTTSIYMWGDKMIEFHTCKTCGCTTHWAPADKTFDRMAGRTRG